MHVPCHAYWSLGPDSLYGTCISTWMRVVQKPMSYNKVLWQAGVLWRMMSFKSIR